MEERGEEALERQAVAVITGASSGLGAALTRLLDRTLPEDVELWLIARDREKLTDFATGLTHRTRVLAYDLTLEATFDELKRLFDQEQPAVQLLINNAGEGCSGSFCSQEGAAHQALCDLNVRAQLALTSQALPWMGAGSSLLFVASVAAFLPQPGFAAYAASKAFILSFGRALREELKERGIRVTITCPNPMLTDFFTSQQKEALLKSYKRFGIEDPDRVAEKTLAAMRRDKGLVVTSPSGKLIRLAAKLLPTGLLLKWIRWK